MLKRVLIAAGVLLSLCGSVCAQSFPGYPSAGQVPIGQGSSSPALYQSLSGDCSINSSGAVTCTKLNGVSPGSLFSATVGSGLNVTGGALGLNTALPNGTTATTQSGSDNSTLLATDAFVQSIFQAASSGLTVHTAVVLMTTTALPSNTYNNGSSGIGATLTATANGALTVDGTSPSVGNRIGVKNESTTANNGIYTVTQVGSVSLPYILTRATDANTPGTGNPNEIGFGTYVLVTGGSTNANSGWIVASTVATIGTSAITWSQFSAAFNGVASIGGQVGVLTCGSGIGCTSSSISNAGVLSLASQTGALGLQSSLSFSGSNLGINLGNPNLWTGQQTINVNDAGLVLNAASSHNAYLSFQNAGSTLSLFQQSGSALGLYDNSGSRYAYLLNNGGGFAIMPGGGNITLGSASSTSFVPNAAQLQFENTSSAGDAFIDEGGANQLNIVAGSGGVYHYASGASTLWGQDLSGAKYWYGNLIIGGGDPYVNVKSGANGCAAAVGNGSTNDQAAIQCQENYAKSNDYNLFFPCGTYLVNGGGLTVSNGVRLLFENESCDEIEVTDDETAIAFDSTALYASLEHAIVGCYQNASAANHCVTVADNALVNISYSKILGGNCALDENGIDGMILQSYISGWNTCNVYSTGANWYVRDKLDTTGSNTPAYGFAQGVSFAGASSAENHFIHTDFSGSFTTKSINIDDGGAGNAITVFEGSVASNAILEQNAKVTLFGAMEFGGAIAANNPTSISNSYAFSGTTVTGSGSRSCAANINITC